MFEILPACPLAPLVADSERRSGSRKNFGELLGRRHDEAFISIGPGYEILYTSIFEHAMPYISREAPEHDARSVLIKLVNEGCLHDLGLLGGCCSSSTQCIARDPIGRWRRISLMSHIIRAVVLHLRATIAWRTHSHSRRSRWCCIRDIRLREVRGRG